MAEVVLRTVGPADASLFARIAPDVFDGPVVPERLAAYLASPEHLMVLAVSDDVIVGQVAGVVHRHPDLPTELYIDNLGVTPALRRQGVGRRLVEAVIALAANGAAPRPGSARSRTTCRRGRSTGRFGRQRKRLSPSTCTTCDDIRDGALLLFTGVLPRRQS